MHFSKMRITVFPCGSNLAKKNYIKTVFSAVLFDEVEGYLKGEQKNLNLIKSQPLDDSGRLIRLWGVKPNANRNCSDLVGSTALFSGSNVIFSLGKISECINNPELAKYLWGEDTEKESIVVITELSSACLPCAEANKYLGYNENYRYREALTKDLSNGVWKELKKRLSQSVEESPKYQPPEISWPNISEGMPVENDLRLELGLHPEDAKSPFYSIEEHQISILGAGDRLSISRQMRFFDLKKIERQLGPFQIILPTTTIIKLKGKDKATHYLKWILFDKDWQILESGQRRFKDGELDLGKIVKSKNASFSCLSVVSQTKALKRFFHHASEVVSKRIESLFGMPKDIDEGMLETFPEFSSLTSHKILNQTPIVVFIHGIFSSCMKSLEPLYTNGFRKQICRFDHQYAFKSVEDNAKELLDCFPANPPNDQRVILLAHSRGGLVAKLTAKGLLDNNYEKVEVYTFGTPHLGTATAAIVEQASVLLLDYMTAMIGWGVLIEKALPGLEVLRYNSPQLAKLNNKVDREIVTEFYAGIVPTTRYSSYSANTTDGSGHGNKKPSHLTWFDEVARTGNSDGIVLLHSAFCDKALELDDYTFMKCVVNKDHTELFTDNKIQNAIEQII